MTVTTTTMTGPEVPGLYVACPLTNLTLERRRSLGSEVAQVRSTIEAVTVGDRVDGETWPVRVYTPITHTDPGSGDGMSPRSVYTTNLSQVLDADGLIALADISASAGVGQEVEWACRAGVPVLYLTCSQSVSRQIQGIPADITCVAYGSHAETIGSHVTAFLRQTKPRILDGPRRRQARRLRFAPVHAQLLHAWRNCSDPTSLAARCCMSPDFVDLMLADAARVAMLSLDALAMLSAELRVDPYGAPLQLPVPATRALILASIDEGWDDRTIELLRQRGIATNALDPRADLTTLASWQELLDEPPSS